MDPVTSALSYKMDTFPFLLLRPKPSGRNMLSATTNLLRTNIRAFHSIIALSIIIARPSVKFSQLFPQRYQLPRMALSDSSVSTHERVLAALARLSRRDLPRNPSKRTPNKESRNNLTDRIKKALQEASLRTWGFPIYRCTYESDADWAEFLHRY